MRKIVAVLALACLMTSMPAAAKPQSGVAKPHFSGTVSFQFVGPQQVKVLNDFYYVDAKGETWSVPKDSVSDGASIPRIFWTTFGPPFSGEWMNAALIHDIYCDVPRRSRRDVNRVFHEALLTSGVDKVRARLMYLAVEVGAPRWNEQTTKNIVVAMNRAQGLNSSENGQVLWRVNRYQSEEEIFEALKASANNESISLDDLDKKIKLEENRIVVERVVESSDRFNYLEDVYKGSLNK